MGNRIIINGSSSRSIEVQKTESGSAQIGRGSGVPKYVGARAEVLRVDGGVLVRLTDYKGTTEEIVYEAIQDITFNPDNTITFVLPDGRTITSPPLIADYELLEHLPLINNIEVKGSKVGEDYKLQDKMNALTTQEIERILYL